MRRKAAASAIRRGIAANSSHEFGIHPLSFFSSNFHNVGPKDWGSSPKPRIDLSCIHELDDAIRLFREMVILRPQPSVLVYNKLLSVIVKMKHYSVALSLFDKMHQLCAPINEYTMNIAINCYGFLNRVDLGFAILGSFLNRGYQPDVTTFATLIKGLFLDHKATDAVKLFEKLLVLKLCKPNDVMILTVIDGLCKAGQTNAACELLHLLGKTGWKPNVYAYNAVIDGFCKGERVDDALQLLSQMIDKGISPNVVTCNILVDAFCKEGKIKDAELVRETMVQKNIHPNIITYTALIDGYCLQGKMNTAREVFDSIVEKRASSLVSSATAV